MTSSTWSHDSSFESLLAEVASLPIVDPIEPACPVAPKNVRLLHRLGRGGMGEVWQAFDSEEGRHVAIKFLSGRASRWLVREAAALSRLRHPRIVALRRFGTNADGTAYIVMELVRGQSLAHHVRHVSRLDLFEAQDLLRQLTDALDHAHARGIVHRDVKPSNVMLTDGADGIDARLIDFGISGALELGAVSGRRGGTPGYMSPEQRCRDARVDGRADLWSLAATLYYALTGRRADARLPGALPKSIERWFDQALHDDPRRRFKTAREMSRTFANTCDRLPNLRMRALCEAMTESVEGELPLVMPETHAHDLRHSIVVVASVLLLWLAWVVLW